MAALRPVLLIGLLVAGSGLLVHRFWVEDRSGALPPPEQRSATAPAPTAAPDPEPKLAELEEAKPASGPAPGPSEAAGSDPPRAAGAPERADPRPDDPPAPARTAAAVESRIDPAPAVARSAQDQVPGASGRAAVEDERPAPSAERAAASEPRSSASPEPGARLAPEPVAEARARDEGSGSTLAVVAAAPPPREPEPEAAPERAMPAPPPAGAVSRDPDLPPRPDRSGETDPRPGGPRAADAAARGEVEGGSALEGWGDFGITLLRRSIDRLFGSRSADQPVEQPPAASPGPTDVAGGNVVPDRDETGGAPDQAGEPLRSKSEESIRHAVRAMVALDEIEPEAGPAAAAGEAGKGRDAAIPTFDIVRVEPAGSAVIAGRAKPGSEVEVRMGEDVLDRVKADRTGAWVSTPAKPLPPGDQTLTLAALDEAGRVVRSEDVVVVAIRETAPPAPVAKPEPPPPQPPAQVVGEAPPPQPPKIVPAVAPAKPLAVLLPKRGQGRILQAPGRIGSGGRLALNVLDYDLSGRVELSGDAPPGAAIRIYVDNQSAAEVVAAESGAWATVLDDRLGPGTYTLRLDQLDATGRPVARLETPFTRVAEPPREGSVEVDYVIVQPGNSLWRIARRLSGRGMSYIHIFDANRGQIRDPDLIYPGQVFEIPEGLASAG